MKRHAVPSGCAAASGTALEVVVSWLDEVLEVRRLRAGRRLTLGPSVRCDYPIAKSALPEEGAEPLAVLEPDANRRWLLGFTSQCQGWVRSPDGASLSLDELARHGGATGDRPGRALSVALPAGAAASLCVGPLRFAIRPFGPTAPIRRLGSVRAEGGGFLGLSLALHFLVLGLAILVPPRMSAIAGDRSSGGHLRPASFLVMPEEQERAVQAAIARISPPGGAAAPRAAGREGKMGDPREARHGRRSALAGTPGAEVQPRGPQRVALVEALGRSRAFGLITDPDRDPLGEDAQSALGELVAELPGPSSGMDGLGERGDGPGGGCVPAPGRSCEQTIGLGDRWGPGIRWPSGPGGRRGRGPGGYPALPRRPEADIEPPGRGVVHTCSLLDKQTVRRVIRLRLNEVRYCYEQGLLGRPDLTGKLVVRFTVVSGGRVAEASVVESSLGSEGVGGCVLRAVRRWQFPTPPASCGVYVVSYPFVFRAAGGD